VLYRTAAVSALPREASDALNHDALDAVLNFSARSAGVFRNCVTNEGLERRCARMLAACISKATAAALEPLRFRELRVAAAPNQDALLACLG
jgi:uroporphyrinogen-III synthase